MNEQYTGKDVLLRLRDTMHCRSTNELRRDAGNEIEQLRAEISRLTSELDEAKAEIEERRLDGQRRCACEFEEGAIRPVVECLVHRTWRRVDSELPVLAGSMLAFYPECGNSVAGPVQRIYYSPSLKQPWGGSDCTGTPTHWMPLPAAPNEAGK